MVELIGKVAAGMLIDGVNPDGPASGKLKKGDLLASIDGKSPAGDNRSFLSTSIHMYSCNLQTCIFPIIFNGLGKNCCRIVSFDHAFSSFAAA